MRGLLSKLHSARQKTRTSWVNYHLAVVRIHNMVIPKMIDTQKECRPGCQNEPAKKNFALGENDWNLVANKMRFLSLAVDKRYAWLKNVSS